MLGRGGGIQGASVCSVSAVIVKQQVEAGALLRFSQKAVGEESSLLEEDAPPPSLSHPLLLGHIIVKQHNIEDVSERLNKTSPL